MNFNKGNFYMENNILEQKTRIEWDKYESVLLLDAVISIYENGKNKKTVIFHLSSFLRQRAILNGLQIDSIYRNENGISLQSERMKFCFYNGQKGMAGTSKIFNEVCELYKSSRDEYNRLLEIAKQLPESHEKLKNEFFNWLHSNTDCKSEDVNNGFLLLDEFCKKQKAFYKSFYSLCSEHEIALLITLLQDDKDIVSYVKENKIDIVSCIRYFADYLGSRNNIASSNFPINEDNSLPFNPNLQDSIIENPHNQINFLSWMNSIGMAPATSKSYSYQLSIVNWYAISKNYCDKSFDQLSIQELEQILLKLKQDGTFTTNNSRQHNAPSASFAKYIVYRKDNNLNITDTSCQNNCSHSCHLQSEEKKEHYEKILEKEFFNGIDYKSPIHLRSFKNYYKEYIGEELVINNEELSKELTHVGIRIEEKVYPTAKFTNNPLLISIYSEIQELFSHGASCVFAECIYFKYSQQLAQELTIYNYNMLITILCHIYPQLIVRRDYFCSSSDADYALDILEFFKNEYMSSSYQEVHEKLWYIPLDKIKKVFADKRFKELVNVDAETFFYAPHISLSEDELQQITREMDNLLINKGYIVAKDFPEILKKANSSLPFIFEGYKNWAIREILKYFLSDKFSFKSVVSENNKPLDNGKMFRAFCEDKNECSVDELKSFAADLGTIIYWHDVLSVMIRVDKNLLVNKENLNFNYEALDDEIAKQCPGDYTPLHEILLYEHFPLTSGYKCNGYLLESYLLNHSKKFFLVNSSIAEKGYYGIIVRRSSPFKSYRDVVIDLLAHSFNWTDCQSALQVLVETGCQARKKLDKIDQIVEYAQRKREEIVSKGNK